MTTTPEKLREIQRRFRANHPDRVLAGKRAWSAKHREQIREYRRRHEQAHPEQEPAWNALRNAMRNGVIAKLPCAECGSERVQAHHYLGYAPEHWLDVAWLCANHHKAAHARV